MRKIIFCLLLIAALSGYGEIFALAVKGMGERDVSNLNKVAKKIGEYSKGEFNKIPLEILLEIWSFVPSKEANKFIKSFGKENYNKFYEDKSYFWHYFLENKVSEWGKNVSFIWSDLFKPILNAKNNSNNRKDICKFVMLHEGAYLDFINKDNIEQWHDFICWRIVMMKKEPTAKFIDAIIKRKGLVKEGNLLSTLIELNYNVEYIWKIWHYNNLIRFQLGLYILENPEKYKDLDNGMFISTLIVYLFKMDISVEFKEQLYKIGLYILENPEKYKDLDNGTFISTLIGYLFKMDISVKVKKQLAKIGLYILENPEKYKDLDNGTFISRLISYVFGLDISVEFKEQREKIGLDILGNPEKYKDLDDRMFFSLSIPIFSLFGIEIFIEFTKEKDKINVDRLINPEKYEGLDNRGLLTMLINHLFIDMSVGLKKNLYEKCLYLLGISDNDNFFITEMIEKCFGSNSGKEIMKKIIKDILDLADNNDIQHKLNVDVFFTKLNIAKRTEKVKELLKLKELATNA